MSDPSREESSRLAALHDLSILDTEEEQAFDRITEISSLVFAAPIALVSLVDDHRQWFKSRRGLDICETSRSDSICAHALGAREPLVVEDTLDDPRFRTNLLVTGPPFIRFYAGAPIHTSSGFDIGTLCVIDTEPRERPGDKELRVLECLAATVSLLIEQRRVALDLQGEIERRAEAERQASAAKDLAEEANAAMRSFFSKMSHDLRTPLGIILGYCEFLREAELTEEQMEDVEEIRLAGRNLLALIDELLKAGAEVMSPEVPRAQQ